MAEDEKPILTDHVSTWLTRISAIGASLAAILAILFPRLGDRGKTLAYAIAVLLALSTAAFFYYKRYKASKRVTVQLGEPLPTSAMLRGLLPFEEGDNLIGRSSDLQALSTLIRSSGFRFGVVWGQSGCGKTSLLRAGLVPLLHEKGIRPIYLAKPTSDPIAAITSYLRPARKSHEPPTVTEKDTKPENLFVSGDDYRLILIIIDQFEEYFLINRTKQSLEPFKEWLGRCVNDTALPVAFLLSIREDFFARLQKLAPEGSDLTSVLDPTSRQTSVEIENLRARQAKEVLVASLTTDNTSFEEALIERLVRELETDGYIRPPELQLVATHLKRKGVTGRNQYDSLGGAQGILSSYIKDEIRRSSNEYIARLTLRMMCASETQTKSPTDVGLEDLENALSEHNLKTKENQEQLKTIVNQFIMARIILRTEDDKYNLVHDYLAPLVLAATEGLETHTERANRLFKRYIAQYKDDQKLLIPFRHLSLIRKHASNELRSTENGKALLRKSTVHAFVPLLIPAAIVLLPILASYLFLMNSYYLSTNPSNYKGGSPRIVVRAGHPNLKFLPGFDYVAIDSGFSMTDLATENAEAVDAFPREVISGFYASRANGYAKWVEYILSRMPPLQQGQAYRLLNNTQSSRDVLVKALREKPNLEVALSLGNLAKANQSKITDEFLQPIQEITKNAQGISKETQLGATIALSEIAKDRSYTSPLVNSSVMELLETMRGIIGESEDSDRNPSWEAITIESAIISVAQANPSTVGPGEVDKAISFYTDENVDVFAKWNVLRILEAFGEANPDFAERVLKRMSEVIVAEDFGAKRTDGTGWLTDDALRTVVSLGRDNPRAVTSGSISPLTSILTREPVPDNTLEAAVVPYSILVKANPSVVDSKVIEIINRARNDRNRKPTAKAACAIALTRLGSIRDQWRDSDAISQTLDVLNAPKESDLSGLRRQAASALSEMAIIDPNLVGDITSIVERSVDTFNDKGASGDRDQDVGIEFIIARLGRARVNAVSATSVKMQIDSIENPTFSGNDVEAAQSLVSLAKFAPKPVLEERERLYDIKEERLSLKIERIHQWVLGAMARATYEEIRSSEKEHLFERLVALLKSDDNRDSRLFGTYGLFLLSIDEPATINHSREVLNELVNSLEPQRRIAATQALEMLKVSDLVQNVKRDKRLLPLNRSKLTFLQKNPEPHINFAAQISLEEL